VVGTESPFGPEPAPNSSEQGFTWQGVIEGVPVVGFVDRTGSQVSPEETYDRDVTEFERRMEDLLSAGVQFAVIDFAYYRITGRDNGRAVVSSLFDAHRRLRDREGALLVCHHPAQFNPDLQDLFGSYKIIGIYRSRQEAIAAALRRSVVYWPGNPCSR
jgi:hypothetical protein